MSFTDALTRISEIQQQITALTEGPDAATSSAATASAAATSSGSTAATGTTDPALATQFAQALAQAQGSDGTSADSSESAEPTGSSLLSSATASASGGAGLVSATGAQLPAAASSLLTSDQQQFASTLVADTGLNPGVVSAWLLAEESGGAAQSRQAASNNDWLNIGYTDSGTVGAGDSVWSDPVSAATATAQWLKGQDSIPGYGTASSGIQSILSTVGQTPQAQIAALQSSGWASSGYPDLTSLYGEIASTST